MERPLLIGTRGSKLALAQAAELRSRLADHYVWGQAELEKRTNICVLRTSGDAAKDQDLSRIGGKGLFVKELEEALLDNRIDVAIHSVKDMLPILPEGLDLPIMLPREDPRDVLISSKGEKLKDLPKGACLGTSSPRRRAQLLYHRPDLEVVPFRGNVHTRLKKLEEGVVEATLLALAGLRRVKLEDVATEVFETQTFLPAVAQGALGLQIRSRDQKVLDLLNPLNDPKTFLTVSLERAFLGELEGSCRTALAGLAEYSNAGVLSFRGQVLHPEGRDAFGVEHSQAHDIADLERAIQIGREAGRELKEKAGDAYFNV